MLFLLVLITGYLAIRLSPWPVADRRDRWRLALGAAMAVAGVAHLAQPEPFVQHLPTWIPAREPVVLISGLVEIALGVGIAVRHRRRALVGVVLALFLVAVFPANVHVAVAGIDVEGQPGGMYPWVRLAFQPLFVWLAVWSTRTQVADERATAVAA